MKFFATALAMALSNLLFGQYTKALEKELIKLHSRHVTISRDIYGVPHIKGDTDADAVFGLMYAQCEDDFKRVEKNYIEKLGRSTEMNGSATLYQDLLTQIVLNHEDAMMDYKYADPWLKKLLHAQTAAYHFYLQKHPEVIPKVIKKFEPWFSLVWTDGSIGAVNTADITENDLLKKPPMFSQMDGGQDFQQTGSNGFAIAPSKSKSKNALLYINPHTSFYYRPEIHVQSNQGLNAYGAVTWGQFFVYQGFNENCGWMHTSSNADVVDTFTEELKEIKGKYFYKFQNKWQPVNTKTFNLKSKTENRDSTYVFKILYTHNGPIVAQRDGKWISLRSYNRSMQSLKQSWLRTKAQNYEQYKKAMDLRANTSNNTVYADKNGTVAYWHGNYMPIRNPALDWSIPQDGSKEHYAGLHPLSSMITIKNPASGFIQNCNSTPFTAAGVDSPVKSAFPSYMAPDGENFRGLNASRLLESANNVDLEALIAIGYDTKLTAFEILIPALAHQTILDRDLKQAVDSLLQWDHRSNEKSIATTLAIEWALKLGPEIRKVYVNSNEKDQVASTKYFIEKNEPQLLLSALKATMQDLTTRFGSWKIPWGDINRFQRLTNDDHFHDDKAESFAVPFASALWGSLPSFNSKTYAGTSKKYGYSGNSFVAAVEFGTKVKAKSLIAGGNSGHPRSRYFNYFAPQYASGTFKDVFFYENDIKRHTIRSYQPGSE